MENLSVNRFYFLLLLLGIFLTGACGPSAAETVETLPTRAPRPTFTPTTAPPPPQPVVLPAETPAPLPPAEAVATDTPAANEQAASPTDASAPAGAIAVINGPQVNLRAGPGTGYALAGTATRGTEFSIVGKNSAGDWWQLCCLNDTSVWIASFLVDTSGPVDSVAVAANLPAPLPTAVPAPVVVQPAVPAPAQPAPAPAQPTATPAPAQPTDTPVPAFILNKGSFIEPRTNSNPTIAFFGTICNKVCPQGGAVGGYRLVVEGPHGRSEGAFEEIFRNGDPGLSTEFLYNVKIEIANGPAGNYRAYVVDGSGNPVSEAWEYNATGGLRTFLPRWIAP